MRTKADGAVLGGVLGSNVAAAVFAVLLGNALMVVSAKTQIPFWPVPMTLQTLVSVLLGCVMGSRLGALTVALYLIEGAAGMPVFAGTPERGIGLAYMAGPTGGYLVGFLAAAWLSGFLMERGWANAPLTRALAVAAAFSSIYVLGAAWLSTLIGLSGALQAGVVPFLLGDMIKLVLAVAILQVIAATRERLNGRR
jgi:biotin transport system substrate-specific component